MALPLGELSPKATERVFIIYPLRPSLRLATSPKGGGKGAVQTRQRGRSIGKRAGQAPPLRYDETRYISKIRTLPLISRLRRQLPPEGKPWASANRCCLKIAAARTCGRGKPRPYITTKNERPPGWEGVLFFTRSPSFCLLRRRPRRSPAGRRKRQQRGWM